MEITQNVILKYVLSDKPGRWLKDTVYKLFYEQLCKAVKWLQILFRRRERYSVGWKRTLCFYHFKKNRKKNLSIHQSCL